MLNNYILGIGLEAFEDQTDAIPVPVDQVYVEPVPVEEANVLVVERNVALEDAAVLEAESAVIDESARMTALSQEQERVDTLAASLEHFIEAGLTPATAALLKGQLSDVLLTHGQSVSTIGGGLEGFDNEEEVKAFFTAGLEALNSTKTSLGLRIFSALQQVSKSISKYTERVVLKAGRMRASAEGVIKAAAGKSGSTQVTFSNKFLVTKSGQPSTNLVSDLEGFEKVISSLTGNFMDNLGGYGNGKVVTALSRMKAVTTVADAKKLVDALEPPAFPGATVSVKDTPEVTVKRTEVMLGGYAVFDLQYKTTGGDSWQEVCNHIKAIGKARATIKRPDDGKLSGKVEFSANLTPQDAVKIAQSIIKVCDAAIIIRKNTRWGTNFLKSVDRHVKASIQSDQANKQSEKGVETIVYQLAKLPGDMMDGVNQLVLAVPAAVNNVCGAALTVAKKAVGGKAAPADDADKGNEE